MGTLVAKAYPTPMFADQADHTYVECGTGAQGWSCWGGKTGGSPIGTGGGGTLRADAIAGNDERAGITCYLINGVCHQAANRILKHARISVARARGYSLSVALFSMYGRPKGPLGFCGAPFHEHAGISGDLDECQDVGAKVDMPPDTQTLARRDMSIADQVVALYDRPELNDTSAWSRQAFQLEHFRIFATHRLESAFKLVDDLMGEQAEFERARIAMEDQLDGFRAAGLEFLEKFNHLTVWYQERMAKILPVDAYMTLYDLHPRERLVLGNPAAFAPPPPRPGGLGRR